MDTKLNIYQRMHKLFYDSVDIIKEGKIPDSKTERELIQNNGIIGNIKYERMIRQKVVAFTNQLYDTITSYLIYGYYDIELINSDNYSDNIYE